MVVFQFLYIQLIHHLNNNNHLKMWLLLNCLQSKLKKKLIEVQAVNSFTYGYVELEQTQ